MFQLIRKQNLLFKKNRFIQLTVEDYVQTMEKLTTDMRFTIYNICYKRILIIWIVTAFIIILAILFSGDTVWNEMMTFFHWFTCI